MKRLLTLITLLTSVLVLTACAAPITDTPTYSPVPISTATASPSPSSTPTPSPTPTDSVTPSPAPTKTSILCDQDQILVGGYPRTLVSEIEHGLFLVCGDGASMKLLTDKSMYHQSILPDNEFIAFANQRELYFLDLSGNIIETLDFVGLVSSPTWSPDGAYVAFVHSHWEDISVRTIHLETGTVSILELPEGFSHPEWRSPIPPAFSNVAWSPDGSRLALQTNYETLYIAEIACDNATHICSLSEIHLLLDDVYSNPTWSPDGTLVAVFHYDRDPDHSRINRRLVVLDMDGQLVTTYIPDDLEIDLAKGGAPAWSPDGGKIAFATLDAVWIFSLEDNSLTNLTGQLLDIVDYSRIDWLPYHE